MKKILLYFIFSASLIMGCKNKKEDTQKNFPVLSLIKSQVAHVDTSLYQIIRIIKIDSTADTTYLKLEEFRSAAKDFLELPDLTDKEFRKDYSENRLFDESLNRVILTYIPQKENLEIQRQEILIMPGNGGEDKVRSIIFDVQKSTPDRIVIKRMLWLVDESFQIVTITQNNNRPDSIITTEVIWNRQE
jgi:hypothetical protein